MYKHQPTTIVFKTHVGGGFFLETSVALIITPTFNVACAQIRAMYYLRAESQLIKVTQREYLESLVFYLADGSLSCREKQ